MYVYLNFRAIDRQNIALLVVRSSAGFFLMSYYIVQYVLCMCMCGGKKCMSVAGTISSRMLLVNEEKVTRCGVRWHVCVCLCACIKNYMCFVSFHSSFHSTELCVWSFFFTSWIREMFIYFCMYIVVKKSWREWKWARKLARLVYWKKKNCVSEWVSVGKFIVFSNEHQHAAQR